MDRTKITLTEIRETMVSKNHMAQFEHVEGDKVRLFIDKIIKRENLKLRLPVLNHCNRIRECAFVKD